MSLQKRVLFIDDNPDHLELCKLILTRRNYEVSTLLGCEELSDVINAVETFRPDVIFLDHNMHGHCGLDVAKLLRSHSSFGHIPIIYFSADDDIASLAVEAGANDFLRKPFKLESLVGMADKYTGLT